MGAVEASHCDQRQVDTLGSRCLSLGLKKFIGFSLTRECGCRHVSGFCRSPTLRMNGYGTAVHQNRVNTI